MNGNPVGEATGSVKTRVLPDHFFLQFGTNAGLFAESKSGAHLNAARPGAQRLGQFLRFRIRAGHPERQAKRADLIKIGHVARTINGFAAGAELQRPARRGVVAAGGFAFDDEAVHVPAGFLGQRHRQGG